MQQDDIARMILHDRERGASQLEAEYRERLYSVAFALCHDATEAEDLVFRTIERVIDKIETYEERDSFYDWMCVILQNLYRDSCRSKMVRGTMPVGGPAEVEPFAHTVDADTVVEAVDAEITRRALEKIPPQMREVLILHYFMDMSVKQIARTLMVAPGTVMSRLYHARRALAQRLGANLKKPAVALIAAGLLLLGATAAVVIDAVIDRSSDSEAMVERVAPNASETLEGRDTLVVSSEDSSGPSVSYVPSTGNLQQTTAIQPPFSNNQQSTLKGEKAMTKRKAAAAALTAAMAAAPLAAANGDEYQFIISGYPVANHSYADSSSAIALDAGAVPAVSAVGDMEARSRSDDVSAAITLNALQFKGFYMSIR